MRQTTLVDLWEGGRTDSSLRSQKSADELLAYYYNRR